MDRHRPTLWSGKIHKTPSCLLKELGIEKTEQACRFALLLQYTQHPLLARSLVKKPCEDTISLRLRFVRHILRKKGLRVCQLFAIAELSRLRYEAAAASEKSRRAGRCVLECTNQVMKKLFLSSFPFFN
jgi:hypothetical protein